MCQKGFFKKIYFSIFSLNYVKLMYISLITALTQVLSGIFMSYSDFLQTGLALFCQFYVT